MKTTKRILGVLLILTMLLGMIPVFAGAAITSDPGVYDIWLDAGVTLHPLDAAGAAITAGSAELETGKVNGYYANAVKFELEYTGAQAGFVLALALSGDSAIPNKDNIVYIDQKTVNANTVEFTIYPGELDKGDYSIYVSTATGLKKLASFTYYVPYTLGDVNGDGLIDTDDALDVLKHYVDLKKLTGTQLLAADTKKDNVIDTDDALQILKYYVDLIESFD